MYRCYGCKQDKPETEFGKGHPSKGRFVASRCLQCNRENVARYQYRGATPEPTVTHKRCPRCGEDKGLEGWYRRTYSADGLQPWCISCRRGWNRQGQDGLVDS